MQTTIGSLLNTPPASANEAVGAVQSSAGTAFSAIFARELQQPSAPGSTDTQSTADAFDQTGQGTLPLILVEESPLEAGLLAGIWAILEETLPLQEVAGMTGERLPDELTAELVDAAFELGRLADELSSALVQKPIHDARNLDPAVLAAGMAEIGTGSGRTALLDSTMAAASPGVTGSPNPSAPAIADVLNRLRSLLDTAGQSTLVNPAAASTLPSAALPEPVDLSGPVLDRLSAISQDLADTQAPARNMRPFAREILQTLSSEPFAVTALPAAVSSQLDTLPLARPVTSMPVGSDPFAQVDDLPTGNPADLVRMGLAHDKSLKSLTPDKVFNDLVDFDALLDEGFRIQDMGTAVIRESNALSTSVLATPDNLLRSGTPSETRLPGVETTAAQQSNVDRTVLPEPRPTIATAKMDVWMRTTEELPDHILAQVARMHAQSLRFNAAGFSDLVQRMTLSLHPEDLGQVDVQMRSGEQISLVFHAREGATRDLLEQNIARLRQMFEAQGISLGDISVGTGGGTDRQARDETLNALFRQRTEGGEDPGLTNSSGRPIVPSSDRLIDIRA